MCARTTVGFQNDTNCLILLYADSFDVFIFGAKLVCESPKTDWWELKKKIDVLMKKVAHDPGA